jgi:hypothetical protein
VKSNTKDSKAQKKNLEEELYHLLLPIIIIASGKIINENKFLLCNGQVNNLHWAIAGEASERVVSALQRTSRRVPGHSASPQWCTRRNERLVGSLAGQGGSTPYQLAAHPVLRLFVAMRGKPRKWRVDGGVWIGALLKKRPWYLCKRVQNSVFPNT